MSDEPYEIKSKSEYRRLLTQISGGCMRLEKDGKNLQSSAAGKKLRRMLDALHKYEEKYCKIGRQHGS